METNPNPPPRPIQDPPPLPNPIPKNEAWTMLDLSPERIIEKFNKKVDTLISSFAPKERISERDTLAWNQDHFYLVSRAWTNLTQSTPNSYWFTKHFSSTCVNISKWYNGTYTTSILDQISENSEIPNYYATKLDSLKQLINRSTDLTLEQLHDLYVQINILENNIEYFHYRFLETIKNRQDKKDLSQPMEGLTNKLFLITKDIKKDLCKLFEKSLSRTESETDPYSRKLEDIKQSINESAVFSLEQLHNLYTEISSLKEAFDLFYIDLEKYNKEETGETAQTVQMLKNKVYELNDDIQKELAIPLKKLILIQAQQKGITRKTLNTPTSNERTNDLLQDKTLNDLNHKISIQIGNNNTITPPEQFSDDLIRCPKILFNGEDIALEIKGQPTNPPEIQVGIFYQKIMNQLGISTQTTHLIHFLSKTLTQATTANYTKKFIPMVEGYIMKTGHLIPNICSNLNGQDLIEVSIEGNSIDSATVHISTGCIISRICQTDEETFPIIQIYRFKASIPAQELVQGQATHAEVTEEFSPLITTTKRGLEDLEQAIIYQP